jgi:hypothetical protein
MEDLDARKMPQSPSKPHVGISTTPVAVPTPLPSTEEELNGPPPTPGLDPETYL